MRITVTFSGDLESCIEAAVSNYYNYQDLIRVALSSYFETHLESCEPAKLPTIAKSTVSEYNVFKKYLEKEVE